MLLDYVIQNLYIKIKCLLYAQCTIIHPIKDQVKMFSCDLDSSVEAKVLRQIVGLLSERSLPAAEGAQIDQIALSTKVRYLYYLNSVPLSFN